MRVRTATASAAPAAPASHLLGALGWRVAPAAATWLELDGRAYRVERLARLGRIVAVCCEAPLGVPLPEYATRRRLRRLLGELHPEPLVVFQDAAAAEQVWTWRAPEPGGSGIWRECRCGPEAADTHVLRELHALTGRGELQATGPAVTEVLVALGGAVRRRAGADARPWPEPAVGAELPRGVIEWVEESASPAAVRALWHALAETAVLDPACGSGGWLLRVAGTLEPVYLACLERMQAWLDDEGRGGRLAHARLADLRRVLERADDTRLYPSRRAFARECIVLRNLLGADANAAAAEACRARLSLHLATARAGAAPELPAGACAVHVGYAWDGFGSEAEVASSLAPLPDGAERARGLAEEAEAIGRADRFLRRLRLEDGATAADLERGLSAVQTRLDRLRARLDRLLPRSEQRDARPLHPWAVFHAVLRRGGFSVVRKVPDAER